MLTGGQRVQNYCSNAALDGARTMLRFEAGEQGRMRVTDSRLNASTEELSIELWMRPEDRQSRQTLVAKEDTERRGYPTGGYELAFRPDGKIEFRVSDGNSGGNGQGWRHWDAVRSSTPLDPEQWYHVAATRRAIGDRFIMEIYVNGVLDAEAFSAKPTILGNQEPFYVGGDVTSTGTFVDPYRGLLHSVTVRHEGLSAEDVHDHYQFETCTRANRLYFSWRLEYGESGSREYHVSPEVVDALRGSPLDSFAPELAYPFSSEPVQTESLADAVAVAKAAATEDSIFFWPRIYLNRIVGCAPAEDGVSGTPCSGPQFESRFRTAADREYFTALSEKGMGVWEEDELPGGALDQFYHEYFQTALQIAKESKVPGVVLDLEKYNNYALKGLVYLGAKDPLAPELHNIDLNSLSSAQRGAIRARVMTRMREVVRD